MAVQMSVAENGPPSVDLIIEPSSEMTQQGSSLSTGLRNKKRHSSQDLLPGDTVESLHSSCCDEAHLPVTSRRCAHGHVLPRLCGANRQNLTRDSSDASLLPLMPSVHVPKVVAHAYTGPAIIQDSPAELRALRAQDCTEREGEKDAEDIAPADSLSCLAGAVRAVQLRLETAYDAHRMLLRRVCLAALAVCFVMYLTCALVHDARQAAPLALCMALVLVCCTARLVSRRCGEPVREKCVAPVVAACKSRWTCIKWLCISAIVLTIALYLMLGSGRKQLVSLAGYFTFLIFLFLFSKHPTQVKLRPVVWGLGLQLLLAVITLRTSWGLFIFRFLGRKMQVFLSFADTGAQFVFGESYEDHFFAFKVLPVIVFFSCVIATLYYLRVMQCVIARIAWLMQVTMATTATESLIAASNIFVGQTEAPILVRPFIEQMTVSELHAMMTAGFATIAGGVLAAYILFGVPAEHLLCASVMNAPAALAVSKLFYPETETPALPLTVFTHTRQERNLLEAASAGASASITLVANIAANLIAFLALLAFVNALFSWAGAYVGYPDVSFQWVCSYVFMPVALLMGVTWADCGHVAQLLGMKTFLNEFVAYEELSKLINNRRACVQPAISVRSEVLAAYALCGFANLSSIGIQLGGIGPMAPSRRGDLAKIAVRALIAGTLTCFITACVAGVLMPDDEATVCTPLSNATDTALNLTRVYGQATESWQDVATGVTV